MMAHGPLTHLTCLTAIIATHMTNYTGNWNTRKFMSQTKCLLKKNKFESTLCGVKYLTIQGQRAHERK